MLNYFQAIRIRIRHLQASINRLVHQLATHRAHSKVIVIIPIIKTMNKNNEMLNNHTPVSIGIFWVTDIVI